MGQGELKNTLKVQRAIRDITQEELAAAIGVTRKTINTIENGVYTPSSVLALKLARYFDVPVEQIFQLTE
ncbi:MAG: helix-turn-helix transcriptional regulator [Alistipes sp.]|jgi:putative transcriptional regulator|nr:helix-turn-helix transcriptional regulator [Alistipes sp.]